MSYATEFLKELKTRELNSFTHRDILTLTNTNCSYSVLRDIKEELAKDGYQLVEFWEQHTNVKNETKKFRKYFIEKVA